MDAQLETAAHGHAGSWVITDGKPVRLDPTEFDPEAEKGVVKEYRISALLSIFCATPKHLPA